jgi:hypothetical protein
VSADPNRLLFVISARGYMTWTDYCEAVDFLSADNLGRARSVDGTTTRSGLLQCLEALGHCDAYYDKGHSTIAAAPPALCRLPRAGLPVAVLTGARCLRTQEQLAEATEERRGAIQITTERHPGPLGLLPDTVLVRSESEDALAEFSAKLGLRCPHIPPAWTLVNWCGTLSEYVTTLDYRVPEGLNWIRYDFCVNSHAFIRTLSESHPRYSRYLNPATGLPVHVFFRDGSGAEVDLSWGRYLLLNAKGITVTAYDERRFRLCVPVKTPLPAVIARTLCLCSGKPPVRKSGASLVRGCECRDWLMFEDVPPQIATAVLSKVGQSPARIEIR